MIVVDAKRLATRVSFSTEYHPQRLSVANWTTNPRPAATILSDVNGQPQVDLKEVKRFLQKENKIFFEG